MHAVKVAYVWPNGAFGTMIYPTTLSFGSVIPTVDLYLAAVLIVFPYL